MVVSTASLTQIAHSQITAKGILAKVHVLLQDLAYANLTIVIRMVSVLVALQTLHAHHSGAI
jgi:hypothetical protein